MSRGKRSRLALVLAITWAHTTPLGCGEAASPQVSQPMDFYVAFPPNFDLTQDAALSLNITGSPSVGGTVTIPGFGFSRTFMTDASGLASVSLPDTAMLNAWDTVLVRGVIVHSADSVAVLAITDKTYSMHPAALIPATGLGTNHYVMSAGAGGLEGSFLAIVGTADVTTVTITPAVNAGTRTAGTPFQVTLHRGGAYQLMATGTTGDLTGTQVASDKPIAVFGGHMAGRIPPATSFTGLLWAAIPPTTAVTGTDFFALPLSPRNGYWLRVLGLQDGTAVTSTGITGMPATLNAGQFVDARTTTAARIGTTYPILVAQMAEGAEADGQTGSDPCFTLLPPVSGFTSGYLFAAPTNQVATLNANIVAPTSAVGSVRLNGSAVGAFTAIGSTAYSGATVSLSAGVNSLTSNGAVFGALVYGWASATGYNGFCFTPHPRF